MDRLPLRPLAVEDRAALDEDPADAAVRPDDAVLVLELTLAARILRGPHRLEDALDVLRMNHRRELAERDRLLVLEADDAAGAGGPVVDAGDRIVVEGAEAGGVRRELDPLVRRAHRLAGPAIALREPRRGPHHEDREAGVQERRDPHAFLLRREEDADQRDRGAARRHDHRLVAARQRKADDDRQHVRDRIERAERGAHVGDEEDREHEREREPERARRKRDRKVQSGLGQDGAPVVGPRPPSAIHDLLASHASGPRSLRDFGSDVRLFGTASIVAWSRLNAAAGVRSNPRTPPPAPRTQWFLPAGRSPFGVRDTTSPGVE